MFLRRAARKPLSSPRRQVLSACAVSFAHGSNDVANAVGSFSASFTVYETMKVPGANSPL